MTNGRWVRCAAATLVLVLAGCGGGDNAAAGALPDTTRQQVDATVQAQLAASNAPGAIVLVDIPGTGFYAQAYGVADLLTHAPRTVNDPFRIASITKTFTATAVLQLIGRGKLAVTDTVSAWYPTFPNGEHITIDDLLRMRSGIADSADSAFLVEYDANPLLPLTAEDMIARSAARGAEFTAPDTQTVYTNVNFMLLQRIAEKVDGRPINAQLVERVYKPLGMLSTVYPTSTQTTLPGSTHGYSFDTASQTFVDKTTLNPEPAGGAGAMISTLADLRLYARAICTDSGLLPSSLYRARAQGATLAGEPDFVRYGGGLELLGQFCGHNGTIMGFSSEMFYLPAKDAVVVINVNRLDADDHSLSTTLFLLLTKQLFPGYTNW